MPDPVAASQGLGSLLGELAAFGLAIGLSPLHIGLLLLLLLGPKPLQRGGWFVAGWLITAVVAVTLLTTVGQGLFLSMDKGSSHRTGLDLVAAGVLLGLGLKELLNKGDGSAEPPGWTRKLDQFCSMPLPLLLAISAALEVVRPDALFLFTKTAGTLLASGLGTASELLVTGVFSVVSASLLLIPLLALVLAGPERVLAILERGKQWLFAKGDLLVGLVGVALGLYLGWQGIEGLGLV
jgi:hypothetical protein